MGARDAPAHRAVPPRDHGPWDPGVYTDEDRLDARMPSWGYASKRGHHERGADARDAEGDGVSAVPVQPMEGVWALWRSWLRPHRGLSQEQLPLSLGFFAFVHNVRKRGKALPGALIERPVT